MVLHHARCVLHSHDKKYFSLRVDVYQFVIDHWSRICASKKRSENWKKQLQDTLSHNKKLFVSGYEQYKQNGFWGLKQIIDPWEVTDADGEEDEDDSRQPACDPRLAEYRTYKTEILQTLEKVCARGCVRMYVRVCAHHCT